LRATGKSALPLYEERQSPVKRIFYNSIPILAIKPDRIKIHAENAKREQYHRASFLPSLSTHNEVPAKFPEM
jgi:hypothetical protein